MEIRSIKLVSHNEDGKEELTIERDPYFLEAIRYIWKNRTLKVPTVEETYVFVDSWRPRSFVKQWMEKHTGDFPGDDRQAQLNDFRLQVKNSSYFSSLEARTRHNFASAMADLERHLRK